MDADPRQYEELGVNEKDVHKIVLSYLVHNCFNETLDSFVASTGEEHPVNQPEDMDKRKRIYNFALDGNASKAIELTKEFAPGLLEENKDLNFDLLNLQFVEIMCSEKVVEIETPSRALTFAQTELTHFAEEDPKYINSIEDSMALLAIPEPENTPMFYLLTSEHRQQVADRLNRAIIAHSKLPSYSVLERVIQQTSVVSQYLIQDFGKDGHQYHQPFSLQDFLKS